MRKHHVIIDESLKANVLFPRYIFQMNNTPTNLIRALALLPHFLPCYPA